MCISSGPFKSLNYFIIIITIIIIIIIIIIFTDRDKQDNPITPLPLIYNAKPINE